MNKTHIYKEKNNKYQEVEIDMDEAIDLYKKNPEKVYPKFFFDKMAKLRNWQCEVGYQISKEFNIQYVLDLGCASGFYLEGFYKNGSTIHGMEYMYEQSKHLIPKEIFKFIEPGDASKKKYIGNFDLVISIETAEHILPDKSDDFVFNLTKNSSKYILFSGAEEGTKGTGHINTRPFSYWQKKLKEKGFTYSQEGTNKIRNIYKNMEYKSKYIRFLGNHVVWFVKD
jgi:cyclopropane fatty-acyl-phospholipid synthase-like methyltransferase